MITVTESVWGTVQGHPWKYRPRTQSINAIVWHCTRGGQMYDGATEIQAYVNWVKSPNNRIVQPPYDPFAGIASYGIGMDRVIECVPPDRMPAFSSHPSDEHAISVEVAQSNNGQPIEPETIASCVRFAREAAAMWNIPLQRVFPKNDVNWSGMAGHEDLVQGKASGKTDPGDAFWVPFLAALNEEDEMTPEERAKLDAVYKALTGGIDSVIEDWNKNGNSLLLGYALEQGKLSDHLSGHDSGVSLKGTTFTGVIQ